MITDINGRRTMAMQMAGRRVALAVGIILVAVSVVAIISIAKQRGEAARHDEMTRIASEQHATQSEDKKSEEAAKQEAAKREASRQAEEKKAQDLAAQKEAERRAVSEVAVSEMPQTGPAEVLAIIPIGMTVFVVASYVESRRRLSSSI